MISARYNLIEIIPDVSWLKNANADLTSFTGKISTYLISFQDSEDASSGRVNTKTPKSGCMKFVIDDIIVHSGLSATVIGHWEEDSGCTDSGGSSGDGGGGYNWIPDWYSGTTSDWSGGGVSGGGGSGDGSGIGDSKYEEIAITMNEDVFAEFWEERIDDSQLDPCVSDILADLKDLNTSLGMMLNNISNSSTFFNWKLSDGSTTGNAGTDPRYSRSTKTVTTTFDISKFEDASDLSIARTIMHESLHGWLLYWVNEEYGPGIAGGDYVPDYPELLSLFASTEKDLNELHHEFIASEMIGKLTTSLYQYSQSKGYGASFDYIGALAWGGLEETDFFRQQFTATEEINIKHVINIEQKGSDYYGNTKTQKGASTNCN